MTIEAESLIYIESGANFARRGRGRIGWWVGVTGRGPSPTWTPDEKDDLYTGLGTEAASAGLRSGALRPYTCSSLTPSDLTKMPHIGLHLHHTSSARYNHNINWKRDFLIVCNFVAV